MECYHCQHCQLSLSTAASNFMHFMVGRSSGWRRVLQLRFPEILLNNKIYNPMFRPVWSFSVPVPSILQFLGTSSNRRTLNNSITSIAAFREKVFCQISSTFSFGELDFVSAVQPADHWSHEVSLTARCDRHWQVTGRPTASAAHLDARAYALFSAAICAVHSWTSALLCTTGARGNVGYGDSIRAVLCTLTGPLPGLHAKVPVKTFCIIGVWS